MKTGLPFQAFLAILVAASLACTFGIPAVSLKTGPTETMTLNEAVPNVDETVDVNLSMTVGEINLSGGADRLLEGDVRYNVSDWKPTVTSTGTSLSVSQGVADDTPRRFPGDDVINIWDLKLGSFPMNLTLSAGAYEAGLDLSGVPLRELNIQDGASLAEIRFDVLNPEHMQKLVYQTGASQITFLGLANANFSQMIFEGGAGEYTFDFSGDLQQDANITIQAGLSEIVILVPEGMSAEVSAENAIGQVSTQDGWLRKGDHFENQGSGPKLFIKVDMGTGSLNLVNK